MSVELTALELIVSAPLTDPAVAGVKTAVKTALCPALRVRGSPGPVTPNPLPLAVALVTVTASPPVFVTVTGAVLFVPTVTLPKSTLAGLGVSAPPVNPVPESAMLSGELEASDVIFTDPAAAPALVGENATLKLTLWLTPTVVGSVRPLMENPVPAADAAVIVTATPPVFVRVSDFVLVVPTCTLPKAMLEGFGVSTPGTTPEPARFSTTLLFC